MDGQQEQLESEKMLAQIEAAKAEAKEPAQSTETPESVSEEAAVTPPEEGKGTQAVSEVIEKAPAKADKPEDDVRKWAEKKGIKDQDSALRSLRELERKMHKMAFEEKRGAPRQEPQAPPAWQPQPQFQPSFAPPPSYPPYMDRDKVIEQEAKRYNMAPEDFERVLSLSNDIAAMQTRKLRAEFDSQLQEVKKETKRNSELNELAQDPFFRDERVQFEMHKVLEENPQAFAHEPMPYRYAFDEAQRRLARKYLQEGVTPTDESKPSFPTEPPKEGAKGSSPSFEKSKENALMESFSKAKTAEEQRKVLTSLGAVQNY